MEKLTNKNVSEEPKKQKASPEKSKSEGMSRRDFLGLSALGLASLTILPSWTSNGVKIAPSDRIVLGFVGLG